jgi:NAD(P)-dependent dehydrogenase (short-subunit alcohol dehydrogenase family)
MSAYCASKHGVIGLMRSVAADTIPHGVTCNAILPGWVRTTMADADAAAEAKAAGTTVDEVWQERAASYAANRVLDPSEIAGVVRFLASDDASGVNGEAITVALGSHW